MAERSVWWGVSPEYRSVQDEHDVDVINLFIGSVFVLGQTAITQTISIVKRLYNLASKPSWLSDKKSAIMSMDATVDSATGLSRIVIIDAVANYFKHHYEWSETWNDRNEAQHTIRIVRTVGLIPGSEENLYTALHSLGISVENASLLGYEIQEWRERLAKSLQKKFQNHGLW